MILDIFLSFIAFFLYMQLGLYVLFNKPRSKVNRAFFYLSISLVIWSFGYVFIHASNNIDTFLFWERISSFGWIIFPALLVNFFFVLKKQAKSLFRTITQLGFYLAGLVFFIQSLLGHLLSNDYLYVAERWIFKPNFASAWYISFVVYLVLAVMISFYLLISWSLKTKVNKEKIQSKIIMITLFLYFAGILVSNYIIPVVSPVEFPGLIHITSFFWVAGFGLAIVRYKFLVLNPQTAASEIIANMKELLFFLDTEGKIIKINQFTEELLGYESSEIINQQFNSFLVDKEKARKILAIEDTLEEIKPHEYFLRKKNRDIVLFNLSSAEVKDDAGDTLGTIIVGYDIRYEKMLEEALRNSEKKFRELYTMVRLMCDNVPDLIWAKDLEKRYIFANKATCQILLNTSDPEEPIGKTDAFFFQREKESHKDDKFWFTFAEDLPDSDSITLERRQAGRYLEFGNIRDEFVYFDVYKAPFWVENQNMIGLVGCGRDVTLEKRMEEKRLDTEIALSQEKELLSVTLSSIGDGVISTDTDGRIVLINKAAEEMTGWQKEEAFGEHIDQVYKLLDSHTREELESTFSLVLRTGRIIGTEHSPILLNRSGKKIYIAHNGAPIFNKEGQIIGVVIAFSDITAKKQIEHELIKIQKLETVGALAGGIAHDFNNIMTAILGNVSMVIRKMPDEKLRNRLFIAEKACFRARDLTRQLLTFAKGGEPVKKVVLLNKMIEDAVLFSLKGSDIECKLNISRNLRPVEVDESQISQVISNLLINAKQAMPDGGLLLINAENITKTDTFNLPIENGEYVKVEVIDTGTGISPQHINHIFDPFYTTKQDGTGLGLAISFNVLARHHGYLHAVSEEGKGSIFTIYLPASGKEFVPEKVQEEVIPYRGEGYIILMDDEIEIRNTLGSMLESLGFTVICTEKGEETINELEKLRENKENLVCTILDLIVPHGMGGKETIMKLREIDPDIKAIVSSGYYSDPVVANYARYGFNGVIEKPYTISNLIKVIKEVTSNVKQVVN
ncbi:MAG: PAS domain S-box protein [Candidatus Cloacimonetes bacterium]|nr:PAS domain S-box protein [Candidatus Cloacimonadota bacterium]